MTDTTEHISQENDITANQAISPSEQLTAPAADIATEEMWATVQRGTFQWPGYEVSNLGHVRRLWQEDGQRRTEPVMPEVLPDGRLVVRFQNDDESRCSLLCKLVAEAYLGVFGSEWYFLFRDGNPANNAVDNLLPVNRAAMSPEAKILFGVPEKPYRLRPDDVRAIRAEIRAGVAPKIIKERWRVGKQMAQRMADGLSYPMIPDLPPGVSAKKQVATASDAPHGAGGSQ